MRRILTISLIIISFVIPMYILGGQMNQLKPDLRLENFKKKIQYNETLGKESNSQLLTTVNVDPTKYAPLKEWTLSNKSSQNRGDDIFDEWIFKNGKESLSVQISLSPKNIDGARSRFLNNVEATSTLEIPFNRGPTDIGTLSIIPLRPPNDYVVFLYKNVYVHVRSYASSIDTLAVCKSIFEQLKH